MNKHRLISAAKDTVTQFLASRFPLKNVSSDMIASRRLNSRERHVMLDLVFRWSREIFLVEQFLMEKIPFARSFSTQEKNSLAMEIFAVDAGLLDAPLTTVELCQNFNSWVLSLGEERYLFALSPFVREHLVADHGPQAQAIAKGLLMRPAKYLAVDQRLVSSSEVQEALTKLEIQYFLHPILPSAIGIHQDINMKSLPKSLAPYVWLMDAGSQIISELINPKPHERVLDLCAGEGNKARYITMKDCHYVAIDIDGARLKKAENRLAGRNIEFIVADGRSTPFSIESFDWILLDAPCTGIGVLRRHPDLMHRISAKTLNDSQQLQRDLLDSAVNLLKPGGRLIYATCSLFRAENEQEIERILAKNSRVKPCSLFDLVGEQMKLPEPALNNNCMTLYPHIDDCDGFFFAALKKNAP